MARTHREPEGPPPPPVVQRVRLRYAKRGRLRFTSTRDFQRALERALRRTGIPVAFSAGFHPHPRISYANAAPTGAASEAEYVEIALAERCDPRQLRDELDAALPSGLDVLTVVESPGGALADRLEASDWAVALPGCTVVELDAAVAAFLDRDTVEVTRVLKSGPRAVDARAAVVSLRADTAEALGTANEALPAGCAILRVVVRHTTPAVRPDDVLTALRAVAGLHPPTAPLAIRLAQGPLRSGSVTVADPLAADEDDGGA